MPETFDWRQEGEGAGVRLAVLGHPIAHSLSPAMHAAALKAARIEGEYKAFDVVPEEFDACIAHLRGVGYRGVNATAPLKAYCAQAADEVDETVLLLGAANTLVFGKRVRAANTDVEGFLAPLKSLAKGSALVIGAGGAASAACFGLKREGWKVKIWNRTWERAEQLAERIGATAVKTLNFVDTDLIVNATPAESFEMNWEAVGTSTIVYDLAYGAGPTKLLLEAADRNLRTIEGREMLVEQGARSFELWTGVWPDVGVMREAVGLRYSAGL
jgi:shikimate dehydrogenase